RRNSVSFRIVRCPTRSWNLDHTSIIERRLTGVEIRVLPYRDEFRRADCVRPGSVGNVHGAADRWNLAVGTRLAISRPGDVVDFLVHVAVLVEPALDNLIAIEVGADRVFQCSYKKRGHFTWGRSLQVAPHWHALAVAKLGRQAVVGIFR